MFQCLLDEIDEASKQHFESQLSSYLDRVDFLKERILADSRRLSGRNKEIISFAVSEGL